MRDTSVFAGRLVAATKPRSGASLGRENRVVANVGLAEVLCEYAEKMLYAPPGPGAATTGALTLI